MAEIKAVYGGASINPHGRFSTDEAVAEVFSTLLKEGVTTIDTARLYGGSEEAIGRQPDRTKFTIDTKIQGGFDAGSSSKARIAADVPNSLDRLKVSQVDILYLHAPDFKTPIAETLEAINEQHKKGAFKRFGLSNFTAEELTEAYEICKKEGYVLPSVYQGNYNPIARHFDTSLFPTLRKYNMVFYAYSPLAGGFLTKTSADLDAGVGRFNMQVIGGMYKNLYDKPAMREALSEWNSIAEKEGVSKAELAYRWVGYHSSLKADLGDAVIFGASRLEQITETARGIKKGKLSQEAAEGIDKIWEKVKDVAPIDNWNSSAKALSMKM